jgi:glucokinase
VNGMTDSRPIYLLAGDIGGTNARLVLYEAPADPPLLVDALTMATHKVIAQMFYKNHDFKSFTEVLASFTSLPSIVGKRITGCCLATAGPVSNNVINFTNREGWIIDGNAITEEFPVDNVLLVNDFVACGYGLLSLKDSEVMTLQAGRAPTRETEPARRKQDSTDEDEEGSEKRARDVPSRPTGPRALIGAGTGLGECFLTPGANGLYQAFSSEGGHVEFAPRTDLEEELLHYLQDKLDLPVPDGDDKPRVSVERVVSGKGLENIYEFLRMRHPDQVNPHFDSEYNTSSERGRLIGAEKFDYPLFKQALEIMFGIYGGEVGNVALKFLPYGGLYIAGGIAPKNIEFINGNDSSFMRRLLDKGRMRSIIADFPVHVVMKEDLGLRGAHIVASRIAGLAIGKALSGKPMTPSATDPSFLAAGGDPTKRARRRRSQPSADTLRNAVSQYPYAYALATSLTAVATAAAIVVGNNLMTKRTIHAV